VDTYKKLIDNYKESSEYKSKGKMSKRETKIKMDTKDQEI
jgi:hypothetical protein